MRKFLSELKVFGMCVLIAATALNFIDLTRLQVEFAKMKKQLNPTVNKDLVPTQDPYVSIGKIDPKIETYVTDKNNFYYTMPSEVKEWSKKFDGGYVMKCKKNSASNYDCFWKKEK